VGNLDNNSRGYFGLILITMSKMGNFLQNKIVLVTIIFSDD